MSTHPLAVGRASLPAAVLGVIAVLAAALAGAPGCGGTTATTDLCKGVTCTASDACHKAGTCDPATGACSEPTVPDGTKCDDQDMCSKSSSCQAGVCVGAEIVTCVAIDQCHLPGTCTPKGGCDNPIADDGTACDDGNPCTSSDTCRNGGCAAGITMKCTTASACHKPGECDPNTGMCRDGVAVDDGVACACGACYSGVCGAASLSSTVVPMGASQPVGLAVGATRIYFSNASAGIAGLGSLGSVARAGGAPAVVVDKLSSPSAVATSATHVFWIDAVGLSRSSQQAAMAELLLDRNGGAFAGLASDGNNVYVTDSAQGKVLSVPAAGGKATEIATKEAAPALIATDGVNVYWWNDGDHAVRQAPVGGGAAITLASQQQQPAGIATDGTSVFWTDRKAGTVQSVPVGGGAAKVLASTQPEPVAITVAGGVVYWTNFGGDKKLGQVRKLALAGAGLPEDVPPALKELQPTALSHDDKCLYWVNTGTNEVRRAGL